MRHHAKARRAGSADGNGRRRFRGAPVALIAGLALVASFAFAGTASAADGPPIISPVTVDELGYTTAKISGTTESEPYYGGNDATLYCFEYSLLSEPLDEFTKWGGGTQACYSIFGPGGLAHLSDEFVKLKPDTTYRVRLGAFNGWEGFSHRFSPEPYTTFTTKAVNKPSATLGITNITLNTARISGVVSTNAPPGPLDAAQKAAYRTTWQIVCRPTCQFGTVSSTGAVEGDEGSAPITWNAIRLETNTYYEVDLIVTNADGAQTVTTQDVFTTPNIAPKLTAAPGGSSGTGSYNVGAVITPYNTKITDCHFEYGPTTEYVYTAPCSPQPLGRNEVQSFIIGATAGDFRLTFRGQTTGDIELGGDPVNVEKELQALSTIGPEGVTEVTREYYFFAVGYTVHFAGPLSGTNLGPMRATNGTQPVYIPGTQPAPPTCCTGSDLGFAGSVVDGGNNAPIVVEAHLTGLTPGATYHYQVFATNNVGTVGSGDIRFVPPLPPGDDPCPNEAVRIENRSNRLPECRAYELVTSAFKASNAATMERMSINDGTISYQSGAGNINNSGSGGIFQNFYIAERDDTRGWETVANLNGPRGSLYANDELGNLQFANPARYAPDLIHSMWYLDGAGYLREPDGKFVRLTNLNPNQFGDAYRTGSDDFSYTLWTGNSAYGDAWGPGIGPGLYEYIGTGNTDPPFRVDVYDNGEPISNCLTAAFNPGSVQDGSIRMSRNGRVVAWTSRGCPGGLITYDQVWVRVNEEKSYWASKSQCTRTASDPGGVCNEPPAPIDAGAYQARNPEVEFASTDGSRTVFLANQQLVNGDTDQTKDLYQYILPTEAEPNPSPNLIQISGAAPNAKVRNLVRASDDGRIVYFMAEGVLASNHNARDEEPVAGEMNLYVWQWSAANPQGKTTFITRLEDPPENYDISGFGYLAQTTPDGRYLVFAAFKPMVETDTDNSLDIYRYDAVEGVMARVSVDSAGVGGNADFTNADMASTGEEGQAAVSGDGEQVVFTTSEALDPDDGNGAPDAYVWHDGRTALISTGAVGGGAGRAVISKSGLDIYFTSPQQLTANDIDDVADVYDARRGGGFSYEELPPCSGEGCQPASTPAPDDGVPTTDKAGGEGNYRPAVISIKPMSSSQRAKLAAGGVAEVPLKVTAPGKISLRGTARVAKKSSQVFDAPSRAVQAGVVNVPVRLSQRALAQLRNKGSLSIHLAAVIADSEMATGTLNLKTAEARRKRSKKGNG